MHKTTDSVFTTFKIIKRKMSKCIIEIITQIAAYYKSSYRGACGRGFTDTIVQGSGVPRVSRAWGQT